MAAGPVRIIYLVMLGALPPDKVREFWKDRPIEAGGRPHSEVDMYRVLWENTGHVNAYYMETAWNDFEPYMHRHSRLQGELLVDEIQKINRRGMWRADQVLAWNKGFLPMLYRSPNPMFALVEMLGVWGQQAFPGSYASVPRHRQWDGKEEVVSAWAPSGDFSYRFLYPPELHASPFHRAVSSYFGMPDFDRVRLLGDCRPPSMLLWDEPSEMRGDAFYVGDKCVGHQLSFRAWAEQEDLRFTDLDVPDQPVVRIDVDHVCPARRRVVLFSGCVYGAPLYLATFRFSSKASRRAPKRARNYLDGIVTEIQRSSEHATSRLAPAHLRLVGLAGESLVFEFVREAAVLRLNGHTFLTGMPARILHKILVGFAEGRTSFDYRSFKLDPDLFRDPKNTGFEIRLRRLQEKLDRDVPSLKLQKLKEGVFTVTASCPVRVVETAS